MKIGCEEKEKMPGHFPIIEPFPVQLRTDLTVLIYGLPWDMTKRETRKLVAVITALENEVPLPPSRQLPPPEHSEPRTHQSG